MAKEGLLPIKVIFPHETDYSSSTVQSRLFEPLVEVTPTLRQSLGGQLDSVKAMFAKSFATHSGLPGVAVVKLRPEAINKSFRPSDIFNDKTCPVIGSSGAGELLVSVLPSGLDNARQRIESDTQLATSHVSTLETIVPFRAASVASGSKEKKRALRVGLFRHTSDAANTAIDAAFENLAKASGAPVVEPIEYAPGMRIYRVEGLPEDGIATIQEFIGTQSVSEFPTYGVVRSQAEVLRKVTADAFPAPDPAMSYGLVGMIDSGTDPSNSHLQAWVVHRYEPFVPRSYQDNSHGSFVAGLIVNGRALNHNDARFPAVASRIVDVVAFDKGGTITEDQLLLIVDDALRKFPQVRVWNLSLSLQGDPCKNTQVSELGAALDQRAKKHNVLFVIAAGNYSTRPFREWPAAGNLNDADRIQPPADAVRGVTVGGLAHLESANSVVKREHPSPFSRRGPSMGCLIKPELVHYAGNCDSAGRYSQIGVVSCDGAGNIAENVGTSFSCPLVATVAANVFRELEVTPGAASVVLTKALLIHSALVQSGRPSSDKLEYFGIGMPAQVDEIINCSQASATVIFQVPVRMSPIFEKRDFPIPKCLIKPRGLKCEMFMTLLYDCPLDRQFTLEYCRTNVTASLGTMGQDKKGKPKYTRQVDSVPAKMGEKYPSALYELGYQWSPLKLYHRKLVRGASTNWRLFLNAVRRGENDAADAQDATVILTVRSDDPSDHVYDEMVQDMNRLGWTVSDLQIQSRVRERAQP